MRNAGGSRFNRMGGEGELDLATIQRRVASIKRSWTPEESRARAVEGRRRRRELEALVGDIEFEIEGRGEAVCESPQGDRTGFCLVV